MPGRDSHYDTGQPIEGGDMKALVFVLIIILLTILVWLVITPYNSFVFNAVLAVLIICALEK